MAKIFKFYDGEDRSFTVRITQKDSAGISVPYSVPLGSVITVYLPASGQDLSGNDIDEIVKDSSGNGVDIINYDRGEIKVSLDDQDTALMKSGDIIVLIQSGSVTRKARIAQGAKKLQL